MSASVHKGMDQRALPGLQDVRVHEPQPEAFKIYRLAPAPFLAPPTVTDVSAAQFEEVAALHLGAVGGNVVLSDPQRADDHWINDTRLLDHLAQRCSGWRLARFDRAGRHLKPGLLRAPPHVAHDEQLIASHDVADDLLDLTLGHHVSVARPPEALSPQKPAREMSERGEQCTLLTSGPLALERQVGEALREIRPTRSGEALRTDETLGVFVAIHEYSELWPRWFAQVQVDLERSLIGVQFESIEHVGSTAVPGLAAKPVLDIDIVVQLDQVPAAIGALERAGYIHLGDGGLPGRESFRSPDNFPDRNVYVVTDGGLQVRSHLAVRDALRARPDLRKRYQQVKLQLAADPRINMGRYVVMKSEILQQVLEAAGLSAEDRTALQHLNGEEHWRHER